MRVGLPGNEEAAVLKGRYHGLPLRGRCLGIDLELVANLVALFVIELREDTIVAAVVHAGPRHNKAGIRSNKAGDVVHLLVPGNLRIGQELRTDLVAAVIENLALNVVALTIVAGGVVLPGDDKAAAVKLRHRRLISRAIRIDPELVALWTAILAVHPGINCCILLPGNNKAVAIKIGCRWISLVAADCVMDPELVTVVRTFRIKALSVDAVIRISRVLVTRFPGDDESAVIKRRYRRILLLAVSPGVDLELVALGRSIFTIALAKDTIVTISGSGILVVALPGDDKVTVLQRRYRRLTLVLVGIGIDLEFLAQQRAVGEVDLPIDTVVRAVLAVRLPGCYQMAAIQERRRRTLLVVAGVGIDLEFVPPRHSRRQQQFVGYVAATCLHNRARLGACIDSAHQAGPDLRQGVARLCLVANFVAVHRDRVEIPDRTRQGYFTDLVGQCRRINRQGIVTITHVDGLGTTDNRRIIAGAERYAVGTAAKVDQQIACGCGS